MHSLVGRAGTRLVRQAVYSTWELNVRRMAENLRQCVLSTANMLLDAASRLEFEETVGSDKGEEGSGFSGSVGRSNTFTNQSRFTARSPSSFICQPFNSGAGLSSSSCQPSSSGAGPSSSCPSQASSSRSGIGNVHSELSRLFSWSSRKSAKRTKGTNVGSSTSKKKKLKTWTHTFVCLAETTHKYIPDMAERTALKLAGLGEKKFGVFAYANGSELQEELLREFPKLAAAGGYELLRAHESGGRELILIDIPHGGYSVEYLTA